MPVQKKNPPKKRKQKKPKVKISKMKALICAGSIFCVCAFFLFLSVVLTTKNSEEKSVEKTIEKPIENLEKPAAERTVKRTESDSSEKVKQQPIEKPEEKTTEKPEKKSAEKTVKESVEKKSPVVPEKTVIPSVPVVSDLPAGEPMSSEKNISTEKLIPVENFSEDLSQIFALPNAQNGEKLIFVFDDAGQNLSQLQKFLDLPFPVTIAVIPRLKFSKESAERARKSGKQVILHQPMEALSGTATLGEGAILSDMTVSQTKEILRKNIEEISPIAGINNHEGSKISENQILIGAVLEEALKYNIFFLDSRTTAQTRAPQAAMERGIEIFERDVFLDNEKTRENILKQIAKGVKISNTKGHAIMIGHVWSSDILPQILEEIVPLLLLKGYKIEVLG